MTDPANIIKDLLDIFLEEIEPAMKTPAWYAGEEAKNFLKAKAKERARSRWAEQSLPKLKQKP